MAVKKKSSIKKKVVKKASPKPKTAKKETFEKKLYDTAEILRGNVSPTSYKDIALGLLFLKYISNRY